MLMGNSVKDLQDVAGQPGVVFTRKRVDGECLQKPRLGL